MGKRNLLLFLSFFILCAAFSVAHPTAQEEEINLGKVYFPRAFVHAGKDFDKGVYGVKLSTKDGVPYFFVHNKMEEVVIEEMAVVKPAEEGKTYKVRRHKVRKELITKGEYFRIRVIKPDKLVMAYFLVKK